MDVLARGLGGGLWLKLGEREPRVGLLGAAAGVVAVAGPAMAAASVACAEVVMAVLPLGTGRAPSVRPVLELVV